VASTPGKVPGYATKRPIWEKQPKLLRRIGLLRNLHAGPFDKCFRVGYWGDMPQPLPKRKKGQHQVSPSLRVNNKNANTPSYNFTYATDFETSTGHSKSKNIRYSRNGFAWSGRAVDVVASACTSGTLTALLREAPTKVDYWIDQGTIIGSVHPMTYGDWVLEHVSALARSTDFPRPLVLPKFMEARPYVTKELAALGINPLFPERAIGIRTTTVLHKVHNGTLLLEHDVTAMRRLFATPEVRPPRGRIVFLSRAGVISDNELAGRDYKSERTERIVANLGGNIFRTKNMSADDFMSVGALADIVIADHGAALFNMIHWRPRAVIELVTTDWWCNCFCFLSSACAVEYHGIINIENKSDNELLESINNHINYIDVAPLRDHACRFPHDVYLSAKEVFLGEFR